MKPTDILGLGKVLPIDKLLDILSKVLGRTTKSYFDKMDIDTKAYEIKKLAEARANEMKVISTAVKENFLLTGGIEYKEDKLVISSPKSETKPTVYINPPIEERTQNRVNFQDVKRQLNIESITSFAAEELKNENTVTDQPLDDDWTTRFFRIAEDITNSEMQMLWGKILAGEIKQPNTYSLRTLEILKNLTKQDAETFIKFSQLALRSMNSAFVINPDDSKFLAKKYGITFQDFLLLQEVGLVTVNLAFYFRAKNTKIPIIYGKAVIILDRSKDCPEQSLPVIAFTKTGEELLTLIEQKFDISYVNKLAILLKNDKAKIAYGFITNGTGTNISHTQLIDLPTNEI